jgi:hypothetical protein
MREENTETESTPTTPSGEQVGSTALFSRALRAICLTRDYVGEQLLPAIEGWEWYDAGVELMNAIPDDEWAEQFRLRTQPCPECQRPNPRHKDGCTTQMMREMHGEACKGSGTLEIEDCPNCDNCGWYMVPDSNGEPTQEQCQWCYTVTNSRFNTSLPNVPEMRAARKS